MRRARERTRMLDHWQRVVDRAPFDERGDATAAVSALRRLDAHDGLAAQPEQQPERLRGRRGIRAQREKDGVRGSLLSRAQAAQRRNTPARGHIREYSMGAWA